MDEPKMLPCPFCGGELIKPYLGDPQVFRHPESETCFARHAIVHPENYAAWNTRPTPSGCGPIGETE